MGININSVPVLDIRRIKSHIIIGDRSYSSDKKIAVVASGDLSHALSSDSPAGYSPEGKKFDKNLIKLIQKKDIKNILKFDKKLIHRAVLGRSAKNASKKQLIRFGKAFDEQNILNIAYSMEQQIKFENKLKDWWF